MHKQADAHTHIGREKPLLLTCCTSVSPFDVFSVYTNELKILCRETETEKKAESEVRSGGMPITENLHLRKGIGRVLFIDRFWFQVSLIFVINTLGLHL